MLKLEVKCCAWPVWLHCHDCCLIMRQIVIRLPCCHQLLWRVMSS